MDISKIYIENGVPDYIPCLYPLIHEYLRNKNYNSYLAMHSNIDMLGVPVFAKKKDYTTYKVNIRNTKKLGYYKFRDIHLGFKFYENQCPLDSEKSLEFLKIKLKDESSVIVCGSLFHLPTSNNYNNLNYIKNYPNSIYGVANHWIAIYDINSYKILIRDAICNFFGYVDISDFINFWKGDKYIEDLKLIPGIANLNENGYIDLNIWKGLNSFEYRNLFLRTIKTIIHEYLNGKRIEDESMYYYFGRLAFEELNNCLFNTVSSIGLSKELLECFNKCLFNSKFNRYIFKDLLSEANNIFEGAYLNELASYKELVGELDNIVYMYSVYLIRNKLGVDTIKSILGKMRNFIEKEMNFFERMGNKHSEVELLDKA